MQCSRKSHSNILEDEIRTFIAVLLLPRYWKVPYRDLYWADAPDTHNKIVSCAMRKKNKKFQRYYQTFIWLTTHRLQKIDTKKYEYYLKRRISISNSMVRLSITALMKALYLTMENTAQNNLFRGKPIRFGFKLWCITSYERYILHAEPHCGVNIDFPDTVFGQGAGVVLGLVEKCEVKARSTVTFDNLFTSLPLLDELTELGIGAFGPL